MLNLAIRHHQAGNLLEAEKLYRQILRTEPGHLDVLHLLGVIDHQLGRHEMAIQHIRSALRERPNFADAHCNLGAALQANGQLEEAVACYREAVRLKPDYAEAHNNLGNALRLQKRPAEALASLQQAVRLRPGYAGALTNLGLVLQALGKLDDAVAHHQQALRHLPNHADAHNNLGVALQEQDKLGEAVASFEQAVRLKPNHAEANYNLGNALRDQGKLERGAEGLFLPGSWCAGSPRADARCNLGLVLQQLSDVAGSEQAFRTVLRDHPRHVEALWQLASLLRDKLPEADRAFLEQRLAEPNLEDADRAKLLFGLSQVYDAKGEYLQVAAQLRQANALSLAVRRHKGQAYDRNEHACSVDNIMAVFTPAYFERTRGFGLETERPVFIVGLPRSATTLTEQILAAHSQVFGAGELSLGRDDFVALATQLTHQSIFAAVSGLRHDAARLLAQRHLEQLGALNRTAARVVDKMPDNYFYLGLLAVLFPRAKFIHCRRDLRDVAVSCWMTHFHHLRWANDPEDIATRFRDYVRLMEHWRTVLPVSMLEVNYEETVTDLPRVARRLVEWCGLDWEPGCLAFYEGMRPDRTASVLQVRQPVYMRSVARWKNYERDLGALFAALTLLVNRSVDSH